MLIALWLFVLGSLTTGGSSFVVISNEISGNQAAVRTTSQAAIDGGMALAVATALHDAVAYQRGEVGSMLNKYRIVVTRSGQQIIVSLFPGLIPSDRSVCHKVRFCFSATYTFDVTGKKLIRRQLWE